MKTPVTVELYYSAAWHDITSDAYTRDPITITSGRPNEVSRIPPSTLSTTIDNRDGAYSPRNPNSSLYGLIGRNTPIRVSVTGYDVTADSFDRVSLAGFGTSEYGAITFTDTGSGGSVLSSDFQIGTTYPRTASHFVPTTNAFRISFLDDASMNVADSTVTAKVKALDGTSSDILGNDIEGGLMLRVQDLNNYYLARVEFNADQTITASLHSVGGDGSLGSATPAAGITYAGQYLVVKAQVSGTTIRMRVWEDGDTEPSTWDVSVTNSNHTASGGFGIRSGVTTGNTNTVRTIYYQNLTIDPAYRFHGEVESWPQRWSVEGNDAWVPITANGLMRRLNAPGVSRTAHSSIRRAIDGAATAPIAYWALDAGQLSTVGQLTSGTGSSMAIASLFGDTKFGAATLAPWLDQGVSIDVDVSMTADITGMSANPTTMSFDWIRQATEGQTLVDLYGTHINAGVRFNLFFTAGAFNDIELFIYNNGAQVAYDGALGVPQYFDANSHHVRISATQNGADFDWAVYLDGTSLISGTVNAVTLTAIKNVEISQATTGTSTGPVTTSHFAAWETALAIASAAAAAAGHVGETAVERIDRLCTEDGIALTVMGDPDDSELVGVQRIAPTLDLLQDAADVDQGILFEPRSFLGFTYRTNRSLYNQTPALELDYSAGGEVAPPLEPVEDTDVTANDVTVRRFEGGFARAIRESGPLNVSEPADDPEGVGRYAKEVTLVLYTDDQCGDQASWLRHIGTWDEARYPVVNLDLTAMDVESKTALISSALSLNLGDRFSIANTPAWLPPETIEQHAQGFAETLASHLWTIAANATPALPYEIYTIGTETTGNRSRIPAAVGQCTLNEALDTTETGVDVISVRKPWIDSAAFASQFPFDIMIGGERMTVTACAGTGLTQTFTVTRSVNGVVKSHASGTEVQLFHPPVLAL